MRSMEAQLKTANNFEARQDFKKLQFCNFLVEKKNVLNKIGSWSPCLCNSINLAVL